MVTLTLSHYRKSLLTEGLKFLTKVFHLFPPIDEVHAKENAEKLKAQALEICSGVMEGLFQSLPLEGDVSSMTVGVTDVKTEGGMTVEEGEEVGPEVRPEEGEKFGVGPEVGPEVEPVEEGREERGMATEEGEEFGRVVMASEEEKGFGLVSDEERETDKEFRLRIFLALLKLACAMVSRESFELVGRVFLETLRFKTGRTFPSSSPAVFRSCSWPTLQGAVFQPTKNLQSERH